MHAGVLAARLRANDLPRSGLVAAYDFARTNFLNWSEDFTQSAWAKSQATVSLVTATLADGTQGAVSRVVDNTNNAQHLVATSTYLPPDNAPQSFVWRLKAAEYRHVGVQWANKAATAFPTTIVDLQDGVILNAGTGASMGTTITATSGGLAYTVTVAAAGNGWYDVTVTVPSVGAGTNSPRPALLLHNSATTANNYTFAGTGTSGVLIHRMQWNATPGPLPYERTTDGQTLVDRSVRLWPVAAGRINLLNWSEELASASWGIQNIAVAPSAADPFGLTRAFTLTAQDITTGSERRVLQVMAGVAGIRRVNSVYLRRRSGTGSVELLNPQNTLWTALNLTADWQRFSVSGILTDATTRFGLRLGATGDQIDFAFPQQDGSAGAALPYERQTHGVTADSTLRGVNLIPNPEGWGASTSPSTLPTLWSYGSEAGITASVTAVAPSAVTPGTQDITINVSNTDAVNRTFRLYTTSVASPSWPDFTAQPGEVFHYSVGLASNITASVSLNIYYYKSDRTFLGNAGFSAQVVAGTPPVRLGSARGVGGGTEVAYVRPVIEFGLNPGTSRSITVNAPMFNRADALTFQRSPNHATLGSSSGADANDPIWTAQGLVFDGVDDYVQQPAPLTGGDCTVIYAAIPLVDYSSVDTKWIDDPANPIAPYLGPNGGMGAKYRLSLTDNSSTFLFNNARVQVGQGYVNAVRVAGLQAAMYHNGVLAHAAALPAPVKAGSLRLGAANGASVTYLYRAVYNRALTPSEIHQAYRFIRAQLSRRGVSI